MTEEEMNRMAEILVDLSTSVEEARKIENESSSKEYFDRVTEMKMITERLDRVHQALTEGGKPSDYDS